MLSATLRRLATWAVVLAVAFVSTATCVVAAETARAQHDCCAAMDDGCGQVAVGQNCCLSDAPNFSALAAAAAMSMLPPQPSTVRLALREAEPSAALSIQEAGALHAASPPIYLVVSVFRL
jgi:hypothetical protein